MNIAITRLTILLFSFAEWRNSNNKDRILSTYTVFHVLEEDMIYIW